MRATSKGLIAFHMRNCATTLMPSIPGMVFRNAYDECDQPFTARTVSVANSAVKIKCEPPLAIPRNKICEYAFQTINGARSSDAFEYTTTLGSISMNCLAYDVVEYIYLPLGEKNDGCFVDQVRHVLDPYARRIQQAFRLAIADPSYELCQMRLLREANELIIHQVR